MLFYGHPNCWLLGCVYLIIYFRQVYHCEGTPLEGNDDACNICRDPPTGERVLTNPGKTFTQSNGLTVSCGEVQEWVQDVRLSGGSLEETRYCELTQYLAWKHCDCDGPDIPSPNDDVKDLNPVCNLCGNPDFDFEFVPQPNKNKLTDTGCCGRYNCEILYYGASQGVLSANLCSVIKEKSGPDCCNLDIIEAPPVNENNDNEQNDEQNNEVDNENENEDYNNIEVEEENEQSDEDPKEDNNEIEDNNDHLDCQDDPSFRFKGRESKNCDWIASKKKIKKFCGRKSFGKRVRKSCPKTCGTCLLDIE